MKEEISLDIAMSKEEMDKIRDILGSAKGLRHYAVELQNGEKLDLVEYKDYQQLETNWEELKKWLQERKFVYNITGEDLDEDTSITEVLLKMQEIERGNSNE